MQYQDAGVYLDRKARRRVRDEQAARESGEDEPDQETGAYRA
jgi:hypothetical protein